VVPLNRPNFTSGHLTIADAQLVRSPVVATDLPTTRDFIEHGRSGLLYALHDAASLREQLIRVRREPALAAAIAAEGQRSEARLSETTRAAFLEALRRLVAIDRPAPSAPRLRQARRPEPETPGARRTTHHQRLRQLLTAPAGQWELQDWRETQTEVVVTVTASRPERLETTLVFTPRGAGGRYLKRTRDYLAGLHGSGYSRREQALGVAVIDWVRRQERQQERQLERQQDPSPATPARGPQRVELSPLPSEDPGPAKPRGEPSLIFDVEVTNRCNLHCRMCPRERMTRPQGNMTQATFYRLLGELSRLPTMDTARVELGFAGQGEPLLHPDLPRFVAAATARLGCRVGITTNGLLLDERRGRQLREAGLGTVHVSVHGLGALHDEIVGATAFERVQRNVERFSAQAAGAVAVQIVLVVSELNRARLDFAAFHRFWTERGARGVERIECHSRGGNLRDPTVLARASDVPAECSLFLPIHFFAWTGDLLACCSDLQGDTRIGSIGDCSWPELLRRKRDIGKPRHAFLQCRSCPDWIPPEVLVPGPDAARGPGSR
jgi:sulfatase maturation enzyme AslB (radical SAM superfamily)